MRTLKNKKGFTLLELLIVLVIIGVIAGLMFPILAQNVEKSRAQEAITALGTVKEAMVRYYQTAGGNKYDGATFAKIGFNPNTVVGGQTPLFTYTIDSAVDDTFVVTATRKTGVTLADGSTVTDAPTPSSGANTVKINASGTITRDGVYL